MPQEWFVRRGDKVRGPLTSEEVKQLVAKGIVARSDMIRKSENSEWRNAGTIKGLFAAETAKTNVLPPLISVDRTPATTPPPLPLNMAEKLTAASPLVNSTGDDIEKLDAQNIRSSKIRNAVWVTCFLVLFALKGLKFFMQDKPRATMPQASAPKLLKTAEEDHIVPAASSKNARSLMENSHAVNNNTEARTPNTNNTAVSQDGSLTEDYLNIKAGHVADFAGKLIVGDTAVTHTIRETCIRPSTIQCEGTEVINDLGTRIEGSVKGKREIRKENEFIFVIGVYPFMLEDKHSDSSIAEYPLIKNGAMPGDTWEDGTNQMKFVGFRDVESNGRKIRRAIIESTDGEPSAGFVIRREYHLEKGTGIVFHRQTVGGQLSWEYRLLSLEGE